MWATVLALPNRLNRYSYGLKFCLTKVTDMHVGSSGPFILSVLVYGSPLSFKSKGAKFVKRMILISLMVNVLVLIPVCIGLMWDLPRISSVYGPYSPARGILLSVYGAILLISIALLFKPLPMLVASLLLVQVIYKLTTPFTVDSFTNPVVISNLLVAMLHLITLYVILRTTRGKEFDVVKS